MPIFVDIAPAKRMVILRYAGLPTIEEWCETMRTVFDRPEYQHGFGFLLDRSRVPAPSPAYVRAAVTFLDQHRSAVAGSRWAVVAGGPGTYSMFRMGQGLMVGQPVTSEVFDDLGAAEAWLREGHAGPPASPS